MKELNKKGKWRRGQRDRAKVKGSDYERERGRDWEGELRTKK
jgi:hypothetical protein